VSCSDYARHELLLDCPHQDGVTVLIRLADGCSGRLCGECEHRLGARQWPGIVERIAGPADALDVLELLRAASKTAGPFEPGGPKITGASNAQVFERDGYKCVVHGDRATEVHHRVHGNRKDRRPSNLLSVCRAAHDWIEHHFTAAEAKGWTVSRHGQDTELVKAWMEHGPLGRGEYLLDDYLGLNLVEAA